MPDNKIEQLERRALELVRSRFPITSGSATLAIEDVVVKRPDNLGDIDMERELKLTGSDLYGRVRGRLVLKRDGQVVDRSGLMTLFQIPYKTLRGTYLVGGQEKIVLNQLRPKPGVYTEIKDSGLVSTQVLFNNYAAPATTIVLDVENEKFTVSVGDKNFAGVKFLEFVGLTTDEIRRALGRDGLADRILSDRGGARGTLEDLFNLVVNRRRKGARVAFPDNRERAISLIQENFANASITTEGAELPATAQPTFNKQAVIDAVHKTFEVARGHDEEDAKYDLRHQRVSSGEDTLFEYLTQDVDRFVDSATKALSGELKVERFGTSLGRLGKGLTDFLSKGQLSEVVEETNPLHLMSALNKITMLGEGGMGEGAQRKALDQRNLKPTGVNRLDPVHTPESGKIGLISHLTHDAVIEDGEIKAKFLRVKNGKAIDAAAQVVKLSPSEEYGAYVAFHDLRRIDRNGNELVLKGPKVPGRHRGKIGEFDVGLIQYLDKAPQGLFGTATNLVPFGHHNDGNRMLPSANMQTQAVNLLRREVPLVQVAVDHTKTETYEEQLGKQSFAAMSPVSGDVTRVTEDEIVIRDTDNKEHKVKLYNYFPLNHSNFINSEAVVKPGDKVNKNQLLAEGWQTRDGKLALGLNARVGYMPFKGYNYEDGIVISEGLSQRMESEETIVEEIAIKDKHLGGRGSGLKSLLQEHTDHSPDLMAKLDKDGIIMVGKEVGPRDILVGRLKPAEKDVGSSRQIFAELIGKSDKFYDASSIIPQTSYTRGKVIGVQILPGSEAVGGGAREVVQITIVTRKPLKLGDKLVGRHGNKGTITKIIPDNLMPRSADNLPLEVIYSPLAVPSRKNLGQLLEANAGLIAEKRGQPFKVHNFSPDSAKEVVDALAEAGLGDGKMDLMDPETGKKFDNPVTVGNMYVMKLKHKVDDKIQARSAVEGAPPNRLFLEPTKRVGSRAGEKHNPQKLGEMEMWGLQAHKATYNLLEATTLKGDGAGDAAQRLEIFRALAGDRRTQDLAPLTSSPESLKILQDTLRGMGLNMAPIGANNKTRTLTDTYGSMMITPMKRDDLLNMVGRKNEVKNASKYMAVETGDDKPEKDGLYDPLIFGEPNSKESRTNWGYIRLNHPLPNPVFVSDGSYNIYASLTPFTADEIKRIMTESVVVITDPGDSDFKQDEIVKADLADKAELERGKTFTWKGGGEAILHYLKKVDVDAELRRITGELKTAKDADRNKLYKKYRLLSSLKKNNLRPEDLMLEVVPVAPIYLRPRLQDGKNVMTDDLTRLYSNLIQANNANKNVLANPRAIASEVGEQSSVLYRHLSNLYGATSFKDKMTGGDLKSLGKSLDGKEGLIRRRMLGKKVDYSGRAVIGVDPTLKLNQVSLPLDVAKYTYKPFIIKELLDSGMAKNFEIAKSKAERMDTDAKNALNRVVKDRPVIINRAPSLHKFSLMAFEPVIKEKEDGRPVRTIQLNPMVVPGFNADFDGDQMAVHVPLTEQAREEAKRLMMPSQNMINPTSGEMIIDIRHEMLLGLYYLTMNHDKPEGETRAFTSYGALREAFRKGEIKARGKASLNGVTSTAGQLLYNFLLPEKYRQFTSTVAKKEIRKTLMAMHNDDTIPKIALSNIIDELKDLGFEAATRSSLSIGVQDFKKLPDIDKRLDEIVRKVDSSVRGDDKTLVAAYRVLEDEIDRQLEGGEILSKDNPVQIMLHSGARGDKKQIRRMSGVVGVGSDITGATIAPVRSSHLDGLSPQEFWLHSFGSRKGMYDRSVATERPGELTRLVYSMNQSLIVTEKDCKTTEGVSMRKNSPTVVGRFAAREIRGKNGVVYARKNDMITKRDFDAWAKDDTLTEVYVFSPMTCLAVKGVCQKCYGSLPGLKTAVPLGEPVGILAAQAMGEPVTQMTMKTFQGAGASSNVVMGFPRIEEILNVSESPINQAVLARSAGVVRIAHEPDRTLVFVDEQKHVISRGADGAVKPLRVKDGDRVAKGDFLTVGDSSDLFNPGHKRTSFTRADPSEMLKLRSPENADKALRDTQNYLADSMEHAFSSTIGEGNIDRRHIEVTVGRLTSNVTITEAGDSHFIPGQTVSRADVERWNIANASPLAARAYPVTDTKRLIGARSAESYRSRGGEVIVREGEEITKDQLGKLMIYHKLVRVFPRQVQFKAELESIRTAPASGHDNWLSNLGTRDIGTHLARGAAWGQVDALEDPRSRLMTGKLTNVGRGFDLFGRARDIADGFTNSLANMFR